jgi:hypothetical protein
MTVRIITDSNGRKHITNEPLLHRPAPVQSCYCPNCEAMGKELAALKTQPAPVQEPVVCHICGGSGFIEFDEREKNNGKWGRCLNCQPYPTPPAQPAPVQEPVARVIDDGTPEGATEWIPFVNRVEPLKTGDLLYTTPPAAQRQWVGLTDEQIEHLWETRVSQPCPRYPLEKADWVQFARAIEAKLKENT